MTARFRRLSYCEIVIRSDLLSSVLDHYSVPAYVQLVDFCGEWQMLIDVAQARKKRDARVSLGIAKPRDQRRMISVG